VPGTHRGERRRTAASSSARPGFAFDVAEISAVRRWVEGAGALLLIADHRPYGRAAAPLATAFGVRFTDGFAVDGYSPEARQVLRPGPTLFRTADQTLRPHVIVTGRNESESIVSVRTFTGQAFVGPEALQPLLVFPSGFVLLPGRPAELANGVIGVEIGRWLQGGLMRAGEGRAAFFGEAAMFSAQVAGPNRQPMGMNAPGAEQNFQFVLNVLNGLTGLLDERLPAPAPRAAPAGRRAPTRIHDVVVDGAELVAEAHHQAVAVAGFQAS